MDAKTRHLALLAALSLFCAGIAWIMDHAVFGSAFFVLGAVGIFGAAEVLALKAATQKEKAPLSGWRRG